MPELVTPGQKYKSLTPQGSLLPDLMKRVSAASDGMHGVHLRLSTLQPQNQQPYHLRAILVILKTMGNIFNGQAYLLYNKDILFIAGPCSLPKLQERVEDILSLFYDDPASNTLEGRKKFAEYYSLPDDLARLTLFVNEQRKEEEKCRQDLAQDKNETLNFEEEELEVSPALITRFEKALQSTDLSNFIRNQAICKIEETKSLSSFFHELYVSITDLREAIFPELPITASSWLFQHMTQTLDERMLILLAKYDPKALTRALSLNLNISTVLSPLFLEFDELVQETNANKIIIEFQPVDIYLDIARYYFAKDFLHERGYKVCMDGVSPLALPLISQEKLDFDLLKMRWGPELVNFFSSTREAELKSAIADNDPKRIILNRCDHQDAISYGHELGIQLFQGRLIDILSSKR